MIRLFHVTKRYTRDALALNDVSLSIEKGGFAFLTGHSGAGKSTLMRLLFAAERPTEGQVMVAGHSVNRLTDASIPILRRNIGVVFQDFKLLNLLADEPTGNLDPALSTEIMRLLENVNARGTTVVVATHDLKMTETFQKRVITLEHGRIKADTG